MKNFGYRGYFDLRVSRGLRLIHLARLFGGDHGHAFALALRKRIRKTKWQTLVALLLILTVQVTLLVLLPYALKLLGS